MIRKILFSFLFLSFLVIQSNAATCVSNGSGNWETVGTWSCGHVPTCGDSIVIQAGHTVTITSQIDKTGCGTAMQLVVRGTLTFQNGKKIDLPCGSFVYVVTGGQIVGGGGGGSSNLISICNTTVWTAGSGTAAGPDCFPAGDPRCSAFLPINLLYFKASICNNSVCLNWATASETNNDFFTVERSPDGKNITSVGSLPGSGTTSQFHAYSMIDDNPLPGTSYYRLKQTDFGGLTATYYWVAVDVEFSIYPNPNSGDMFYVDVPAAYIGQNVEVSLYDIIGKRIYTASFNPASPVLTVRPAHPLPQGIYQVTLHSDAGPKTYRQKLVIQ